MVRHPNRPLSYRRKRHACGVCKPSKRGIAPHFTDRERFLRRAVVLDVVRRDTGISTHR
jgi:hypothetical protein